MPALKPVKNGSTFCLKLCNKRTIYIFILNYYSKPNRFISSFDCMADRVEIILNILLYFKQLYFSPISTLYLNIKTFFQFLDIIQSVLLCNYTIYLNLPISLT